MSREKIKERTEKIEMEMLGEKIRLLFGFCFTLIPEKDKILAAAEHLDDRASTAMAAAPILGAMGKDYEEVHWQQDMRARRARVLYELVKVLEETEGERGDMAQRKEENEKALEQFMNFFS